MGEVDCKMTGNAIEVPSDSNAAKIKRRKSVKKKVVKKPSVISPLKKLLRESETWTTSELDLFSNLPTSQERVEFVYQILPHDATSLDRLWPIQIVQKDSMIRRQLSDRGKECFLNGEWSKVLDFYNEAALFSTCKGLGHTMARRAAYLLQTGDIDLALRDIKMAFDLGCLERELMDFLLAHHTTDSDIRAANNDASVERSIEAMYNPDIANEGKKYFSNKLRADLELIRTQQKGRPTEEDVKNVMITLRAEAEKQQADKKDSVRCPFPKIRPPQIDRTNARYPSFSEAVDVVVDMDKGRKVVAQQKIEIGEIIMTETPNTLFFCPEMEKLPLLKSHCLHCMSYTMAPIPCNECCVVTFCSLECQEAATYHVFECRMKLYEMLHFMGDEYASVFMAIRTITQKPASYFWKRRDKILEILAMDYPEMRDESEIWSSDAIEPLLRLMSHQDEIEPEVLMKNAVIAVFFLRALQAVNYFEDVMPRKSKTDKRLKEPEALILYILNHLINTQSHNATPFMRLVECADASNVCIKQDVGRRYFRWEYLGSSISSSLALINHSCDPNCIQFHVGRYAVLVPIRKISAGQEITIAYDKIHHEDQPLLHRQLHCLRKFYFSCECPACHNDWASYEEMPDTLYLVPNFETEKHFVVRTGDKRDLVRDIERLKLKAEKEFREGEVDKSIASMNELSEYLENDIAKPHQYHIQANHVAMLCVMTKFLKDVAKIVERTNFNKQFPPTYVNGEFVYTEKPTTVEESRYWEHGFVTPKAKKKKTIKKQKTTDSDEGIQTIPNELVNIEQVNGVTTNGLNAENVNHNGIHLQEKAIHHDKEMASKATIAIDELDGTKEGPMEQFKEGKVKEISAVEENASGNHHNEVLQLKTIAIEPSMQSQDQGDQYLEKNSSNEVVDLKRMQSQHETQELNGNLSNNSEDINITRITDFIGKEFQRMDLSEGSETETKLPLQIGQEKSSKPELQIETENRPTKENYQKPESDELSSNNSMEEIEKTAPGNVAITQIPSKAILTKYGNEHLQSNQINPNGNEEEFKLPQTNSTEIKCERETIQEGSMEKVVKKKNGQMMSESNIILSDTIQVTAEENVAQQPNMNLKEDKNTVTSLKSINEQPSADTASLIEKRNQSVPKSKEIVNPTKDSTEQQVSNTALKNNASSNDQLETKDNIQQNEKQRPKSTPKIELAPSSIQKFNEQASPPLNLIKDKNEQVTIKANSRLMEDQCQVSSTTSIKDDERQLFVLKDISNKNESQQSVSKADVINVQNAQDHKLQFAPETNPIKSKKAADLPSVHLKEDNVDKSISPNKVTKVTLTTSDVEQPMVKAKKALVPTETKEENLPYPRSKEPTLLNKDPNLKPKNIPPPPKTERIPPPPKLEKIKPPPVDEDLLRLCMLQIQQQVKEKPDQKVTEVDQEANETRNDHKHRQSRWL